MQCFSAYYYYNYPGILLHLAFSTSRLDHMVGVSPGFMVENQANPVCSRKCQVHRHAKNKDFLLLDTPNSGCRWFNLKVMQDPVDKEISAGNSTTICRLVSASYNPGHSPRPVNSLESLAILSILMLKYSSTLGTMVPFSLLLQQGTNSLKRLWSGRSSSASVGSCQRTPEGL